jgi:hypothetical protein
MLHTSGKEVLLVPGRTKSTSLKLVLIDEEFTSYYELLKAYGEAAAGTTASNCETFRQVTELARAAQDSTDAGLAGEPFAGEGALLEIGLDQSIVDMLNQSGDSAK